MAVCPPFNEKHIKNRIKYPNLGIEEITLTNGVRLILKPTEDEEVLITSFSPGGLACLSEEEYPFFEGAVGYMDMGGIAKVESDILDEYLYENNMSLIATIENDWHGFMGASPSNRLGEFFNLIKEKTYFPGLNYSAFEDVKLDLLKNHGKESLLTKMIKRSPERLLSIRLDEIMGYGSIYPARDLSKDEIQQLNLDSIAAFYKKLYTNISNTTFVLAGAFNSSDVLCKFISIFGDIPTNKSVSSCNRYLPKLPTEQITQRFTNENKTQTVFDYVHFGYYEPNLENSLILKLMRDAIHNRVLTILREQESLVYSPFVSLNYRGIPHQSFCFDINASAENSNIPEIYSLIKGILRDLLTNEIPEEEFKMLKRSFLITKREVLNNHASSAWRTTVVDLLKNGESLSDFDQYEEILDSITTQSLKDAFNKYINLDTNILLYIQS